MHNRLPAQPLQGLFFSPKIIFQCSCLKSFGSFNTQRPSPLLTLSFSVVEKGIILVPLQTFSES